MRQRHDEHDGTEVDRQDPDLVAERVVDELEAVEVHEQNRDLPRVAPQAHQRVAQPVEEERPVREARERVV